LLASDVWGVLAWDVFGLLLILFLCSHKLSCLTWLVVTLLLFLVIKEFYGLSFTINVFKQVVSQIGCSLLVGLFLLAGIVLVALINDVRYVQYAADIHWFVTARVFISAWFVIHVAVWVIYFHLLTQGFLPFTWRIVLAWLCLQLAIVFADHLRAIFIFEVDR